MLNNLNNTTMIIRQVNNAILVDLSNDDNLFNNVHAYIEDKQFTIKLIDIQVLELEICSDELFETKINNLYSKLEYEQHEQKYFDEYYD